MKECCKTCIHKFKLEKWDYEVGCKHSDMEGYACTAYIDEGLIINVVNMNEKNGICECYEKRFRVI